jgi:hypothetical protein
MQIKSLFIGVTKDNLPTSVMYISLKVYSINTGRYDYKPKEHC